jgi:hypothetical protein
MFLNGLFLRRRAEELEHARLSWQNLEAELKAAG